MCLTDGTFMAVYRKVDAAGIANYEQLSMAAFDALSGGTGGGCIEREDARELAQCIDLHSVRAMRLRARAGERSAVVS